MSRSLSSLQALLLGLVVFAGSGLAGVGLFAVGSKGWYGKNALHVRVGFHEVRGVEEGTRVRVQGIEAGEVVGIEAPDRPGDPVVLRLRIRGEYRHLVRKSSRVQIVMEGALGGKVLEIRPPELKPGQPAPDLSLAEEDTLLAGEPSSEMGDVMNKAGVALQKLPAMIEEGTSLFRSTRETAERGKQTLDKIETTVDSAKQLPLVGKAFEGPADILVRERGEWERRVFAEKDLFEPGHAVLTAGGRENLDEVGAWLKKQRHSGSEVVVVSYADPAARESPDIARRVTRQQSEAVLDYLKSQHKAHKLAWYSFWGVASRRTHALGMGKSGPPKGTGDAPGGARVEVLVYKPQS
jgi:phospholipid/cholesterol/gamma-HCH transport system substrate-binding protein